MYSIFVLFVAAPPKNFKIYELPEFAEVCCFIHYFGEKLGVLFTFPRVARLLSCETDADLQSLTTLLVKLLNKMRIRTQLNRWQPALGRFLQRYAYNSEDLLGVGNDLNGPSRSSPLTTSTTAAAPSSPFFSLPLELRLRVLLFCLEAQFHLNPAFKEKVKTIDAHVLRSRPFGVDVLGNAYWLLIDTEFNFLLYCESADDSTLKLISDTFASLEGVIEGLKDEKYAKTPLSELYSSCGYVPKPEPPESMDAPSSDVEETKPIEGVERVKVEEPDGCGKSEAVVHSEEQAAVKEAGEEEEEEEKPEMEAGVDKAAVSATFEEEPLCPQKDTDTAEHPAKEPTCLRRSGRLRKQVEFLTMEAFTSSKPRAKKGSSSNSVSGAKPSSSKKKKKNKKRERGRTKEKANRSKKKHRRKKSKNGGNGNGSPWARSLEESNTEDDAWTDAIDEMLNNGLADDDDNSNSSLPEDEKHAPKDWLEDLESDFDPNAEDVDEPVAGGRNLQRQKAQALDEAPCQICTKSNHPEWLLLCDSCDLGFHAQCLRPPLHLIPEGDWFCPRCLHSRLVEALSEQLVSLKAKSRKSDSAARMQERLNFVNISVTNILRDERTRRPPAAAAAVDDSESYYSDSDSSGGSSNASDDKTASRLKRKRPRYNNSSASSEEGEEEAAAAEETPRIRATRRQGVRYNVNAAFEELDEMLAADEKYAMEKLERDQVKKNPPAESLDDVGSNGPPLIGAPLHKAVRKKAISSSSSSESDGAGRRRRRRRVSSGSEDFQPSNEQDDEEEEDDELASPSASSEDPPSSENSWEVGRRSRGLRRRATSGRNRGRRKRTSRRRIPRFEGSSSNDDSGPRVRRSARTRVNYNEIDTTEDEDEVEKKENDDNPFSGQRRRRTVASSGSEYAPSDQEVAEADAGEGAEASGAVKPSPSHVSQLPVASRGTSDSSGSEDQVGDESGSPQRAPASPSETGRDVMVKKEMSPRGSHATPSDLDIDESEEEEGDAAVSVTSQNLVIDEHTSPTPGNERSPTIRATSEVSGGPMDAARSGSPSF
ncbi:unnamed protein product [Mesocestoides corti]|uniref:PHD-type domain-containing protein n=1 Tax=Mesocestoides corti TaxID=53468 RepID=A0A0R3U5C7_MESCO|nr:unnamed protein product [Mesocestoides corti]